MTKSNPCPACGEHILVNNTRVNECANCGMIEIRGHDRGYAKIVGGFHVDWYTSDNTTTIQHKDELGTELEIQRLLPYDISIELIRMLLAFQ
jgi:hypothetical protein